MLFRNSEASNWGKKTTKIATRVAGAGYIPKELKAETQTYAQAC